MEIKLFWTEFATNELQQIFSYYHKKVSHETAKKLISGIYNSCLKLKKQPEIGQIEELLKDREQNFRYVLFQNYKIIYWYNKQKNWIEIVDIFDTRQNPSKMNRSS